jgi:hypothetical protein
MTYMKACILVCFVVGMSTSAFASRLQQDNGDYGNFGATCPAPGVGIDNSCVLNSTNLFAETFGFSADAADFQVFDFEVLAGSDYTLTITGGTTTDPADFATDAEISATEPTVSPFAYGMFICNPDNQDVGPETNTVMSEGRLCTTLPQGQDFSTYTPPVNVSLLSPNSVQFTVSGNGSGFVFYVIEPKDPVVTATLTPEPESLPVLVFASVVIVGFNRRRLANLL